MKPFDLEEAKAGKPVCTRAGYPVRIVDFNVKDSEFPILALIDHGEVETPQTYKKNGAWDGLEQESDYDLFMKETEKHGWVNIIKNSSGVTSCSQNIWPTRKGAVLEATALTIAREDVIDTIRIKWKQ